MLLHLCESIGLIWSYFKYFYIYGDSGASSQKCITIIKSWSFLHLKLERYFVPYTYEVGKCCYELETLEKWPSNANEMLANNVRQGEYGQGKQQRA